MINNNNHSELEKKVKLLESILESANEGYWEWNIRTNKVIFNHIWYILLNYEPYELPQSFETFETLLHPDDREKTLKILNSYINQNVDTYKIDFRMIKKSGEICWILSRGNIERDDNGKLLRIVGTHMDITDYKVNEERVKYLNSILLAIRDINQLIVTEKDKDTLLTKSCEILSETRGFNLVWIGEIENNNYKVISKAFSGSYTAFSDLNNVTWDDSPTGQGPTGKAIKTLKTCIVNNIYNDSNFKPWMNAVNKHDFNSAIAIPIKDDDKIFGNLTIYSTSLNAFDKEEISLLKEVAADISFAIHALKLEEKRKKAEKRKQELIEELQQFTEELQVSNEELQSTTEELQVSNEELRQQRAELNHLNQELQKSENHYRRLLENTFDAVVIHCEGRIISANSAVLKLFGVKNLDEFLNKSLFDFVHPAYNKTVSKRVQKMLEKDETAPPIEEKFVRPDETSIDVEVLATAFVHEGKKAVQVVFRDISERKKIEESLRESENRYRKLLENSFDAVVIHNGYEIISANTIAMELLGIKNLEEFHGKPVVDFIHPDYHEIANKRVQEMLEKGEILPPVEEKFVRTDGTSIDVEVLAVGFVYKNENAVQAVFRDISERKNSENEIKASLKEKEALLKEIHHRVKNNLQIISSLLDLQAKYVDEEEAINVLHESQNRVKSMAMIHEMLYQPNNLSNIEFSDYIRNLVPDLLYSYGVKSNIKPIINAEHIILNIETAIPCGLIISELVSNSLKYAFSDNRTGEISINFDSVDGKFELIIGDDGIGLPDDLDFKNVHSSLGLRLVNILVNQLDGSIELDRTNGTEFKIKFKELKYKKRI